MRGPRRRRWRAVSTLRPMNPNELTIGLDLFVRLPGERGTRLPRPRFASGCAISALHVSSRACRHRACVLGASGEIIAEEVLPDTRECLAAFAARDPGATLIVDTGTRSPWVSRLLEQHGHPVLGANARKFRAISASHTKNDADDARMLARSGNRRNFAAAGRENLTVSATR